MPVATKVCVPAPYLLRKRVFVVPERTLPLKTKSSPACVVRSRMAFGAPTEATLFWTRAPAAPAPATRPRTAWVEPLILSTEAKAPAPKVTTLVGSSCGPRVLLPQVVPRVTEALATPAPMVSAPPTAGTSVGALAAEARETLPSATTRSPAMAFGPVRTREPAPTLVRPKAPATAPP